MMQDTHLKSAPGPCPFPVLERGVRYLILTVDYEIFGNGSGDVRQHMIAPTERIATLGERFGMPITVFLEVEEYLAFERYADQLRERLGYDPARLIREQLIALVRRGHDVQLHTHSKWHGAHYADGRWMLHDDRVTVDASFEDQAQVTKYIKERKAILESILREADPEREVRAYRAENFCAQPSEKLLAALAANGIVIDSSVIKGLYQREKYVCTDYRAAPSSRKVWRVKTEVSTEDPSGPVIEFPVYSKMGRRLGQLSLHRIRAKFSSNVPREKQKEMVSDLGIGWHPLRLLRVLWQEVPIKLDFHNLSARTLMKMIRTATPVHDSEDLDVLVLLGHTKEHINDRTLGRLLERVSREPTLKVTTFDQLAKAMPERSKIDPS